MSLQWKTVELWKLYVDGHLQLITHNQREALYTAEKAKREEGMLEHAYIVEKTVALVLYEED